MHAVQTRCHTTGGLSKMPLVSERTRQSGGHSHAHQRHHRRRASSCRGSRWSCHTAMFHRSCNSCMRKEHAASKSRPHTRACAKLVAAFSNSKSAGKHAAAHAPGHLQTPQAMMQETTTRSPGWKFFTSGPTCATMPMNCPETSQRVSDQSTAISSVSQV